ncbi:MAG: hypothetical protein L6R19_08675 [Alphaproteobacteria bacterium]|nr:hypothetical protein [Alphaproteobacteria bacterium]
MSKPTDLITPDQLREIAHRREMEKLNEILAARGKAEAEAKDLYKAFMEREIHPDVKHRVSDAVRRAAERGERQVLVIQFSSEWCSDKGRAINNNEPDWPKTLTGFAKRALEYFEKELRPLGYKAHAQILNYPGGMPGDVGLFLAW